MENKTRVEIATHSVLKNRLDRLGQNMICYGFCGILRYWAKSCKDFGEIKARIKHDCHTLSQKLVV